MQLARKQLLLSAVSAAGLSVLPRLTVKEVWGGSHLIDFGYSFNDAAAAHTGCNGDVATSHVAEHCPCSIEWAFVTEINNYRAQNGRGPLQMSRSLAAAARHHAYYMSRFDDIDHTLAGGQSWSTNIRNYGYPSEYGIGENVLAGRQSTGGALTLWASSPTHNANMLDPDWIRIGVGRVYYASGDFDYYWCTTFGDGSHRTITSC